jgi:hypothetical protein
MNFKNIRIYIVSLLLTFLSCTNSDKHSPFQSDYLLNSIKLDENCQSKIIDFLAPMELENDTSKITDLYQLFISLDTTIYQEDEFDKVIFLGLIFNNDSSNNEILACYPEYGMIYYTYLVNKESTVLIANNSSFWNNFKRIENIACLITPDSLHYEEIKEKSIGYWQVAGKSSINGHWLPDTISQYAFADKDLNNEWQLSGDLEIKNLKLVDSENNILVTDKLDFEGKGIQLLDKEKEFMILSITKKAIFLYDLDNEITHHLKKKK